MCRQRMRVVAIATIRLHVHDHSRHLRAGVEQGVAHLLGDAQMGEVDRVEGPAQNADAAPTHAPTVAEGARRVTAPRGTAA